MHTYYNIDSNWRDLYDGDTIDRGCRQMTFHFNDLSEVLRSFVVLYVLFYLVKNIFKLFCC